MKNLIDIILESRGQRISQRASNRPYDVKNDELIKNKESRPQRAQELRETRKNQQVKEFCSRLFNDFIVKLYKLTTKNTNHRKLLSVTNELKDVLLTLKTTGWLDDIRPELNFRDGGVACLHCITDNYYHKEIILEYGETDSLTTILNNPKFRYIFYKWDGYMENKKERSVLLSISYDPKFLSSVLHKLRKHDLAETVNKDKKEISLLDLFKDLPDKYNKNYFADKFKEFESAYNDVLANW